MFDKSLLPEGLEVTEKDLAKTPEPVFRLLLHLAGEVARLTKRVEELEAKLGEDSSNSNKPPSTDSPYMDCYFKDQKPDLTWIRLAA